MSVKEAWQFSDAQQKLEIEMQNEAGQITNRYIKGDERSFTIIAYPVPEIGGDYEEIFRQIVKINTLDYQLYQKIQQTLIDTLDTAEWVSVKGKGANETDLKDTSAHSYRPDEAVQFRELCSGCKYSRW